jgi:hypothetical protein
MNENIRFLFFVGFILLIIIFFVYLLLKNNEERSLKLNNACQKCNYNGYTDFINYGLGYKVECDNKTIIELNYVPLKDKWNLTSNEYKEEVICNNEM